MTPRTQLVLPLNIAEGPDHPGGASAAAHALINLIPPPSKSVCLVDVDGSASSIQAELTHLHPELDIQYYNHTSWATKHWPDGRQYNEIDVRLQRPYDYFLAV